MISRNVGSGDRDARLILGAVLMYLAVFQIPGIAGFVVGGVAVIMFVTAALGFCPLYRLAGIDTTRTHT